jgi:hypothetical protein
VAGQQIARHRNSVIAHERLIAHQYKLAVHHSINAVAGCVRCELINRTAAGEQDIALAATLAWRIGGKVVERLRQGAARSVFPSVDGLRDSVAHGCTLWSKTGNERLQQWLIKSMGCR